MKFLIDPKAGEAAIAACQAWNSFAEAKTPVAVAGNLVDLANAMSDLESWIPYQGETNEPDDSK